MRAPTRRDRCRLGLIYLSGSSVVIEISSGLSTTLTAWGAQRLACLMPSDPIQWPAGPTQSDLASWEEGGLFEPAFGSWGHDDHVHDFHQFLYAPVGHAVVWAEGHGHRVCPEVGLWMPAGVWHAARFDEDCLIAAIGFDLARWSLPFEPATEVVITARRRRMLLAHLRDDDVEPSAELFETLLHGPPSLPLPEPITDLPRAVASALQLSPDDQRTAAEWATSLHAGATTLRRAFVVETGLTFSEWRTRLRLNRSLDLLARGLMVSSVAQRVGFTSTNGFILAFRRYFGVTPGAYAVSELCA